MHTLHQALLILKNVVKDYLIVHVNLHYPQHAITKPQVNLRAIFMD